MTSSGTLSVNTTKAFDAVSYKARVVVGSQIVESPSFSLEVYDCGITFDSQLSSQSVYVGQTFPTMNAVATSTNSDSECAIDHNSYTINDTSSAVTMNS